MIPTIPEPYRIMLKEQGWQSRLAIALGGLEHSPSSLPLES